MIKSWKSSKINCSLNGGKSEAVQKHLGNEASLNTGLGNPSLFQNKSNPSVQDISAYGFVLYFLAFTSEDPPCPYDLASVRNREWLWQRPYTTLEIQCRPGQPCLPMDNLGEGVDHIKMEADNYGSPKLFQDPDGVNLEIRKPSLTNL